MSRVHTEATRPNGVPLATATASSSSAATSTESTGPKISSCATRMPGSTPVSGVGQHDAGRPAAQLQGDGRDVPGRRPHDETAGLQTARERHVVDVVAGGQVGAGGLAATGDDVEGA